MRFRARIGFGMGAVAAATLVGAAAVESYAVGVGPATAAARAPAVTPQPVIRVDAAKELMITHLSVVEDALRTTPPAPIANPTTSVVRIAGISIRIALPVPRPHPSAGKWTFGRLMSDMAGSNHAPSFVMNWLTQWETDQTINGWTAPARPSIRSQVIQPWLAASGGTQLDLNKAPFRLLAIVDRIDLRKNPSYAQGNAGEGRFVFGALDQNGNALPFTVIFEYELPARTLADVKAWATAWHELGSLPFGPQYNAKLEAITDRYAGRYVMPGKPNGNAINQVRTNEIALASPWELREFRLNAAGQLVQVTCKKEVEQSLYGSQPLADFVNANEAAILAGRHELTPSMVAANAPEQIVLPATGIRNPEARHKVALATCSGCHLGETSTGFTHVRTRQRGQEAFLSGFLTGITANDPITGTPHAFNDLAARASDLSHVLSTPTPVLMVEPASARVH